MRVKYLGTVCEICHEVVNRDVETQTFDFRPIHDICHGIIFANQRGREEHRARKEYHGLTIKHSVVLL